MLASDFEKYQFHSNTENGSVVSGGYPILVGGGKKPTDNDWIIPLGLVWGAASSSASATGSNDDHVVSDGIVGGGIKSSIGGCGWSSNMIPMSEFDKLLTSVMETKTSKRNSQRTKKSYRHH
jgi:hypothetical protein